MTIERKPFRDVVRTPFKGNNRETDIQLHQSTSREELLFEDEEAPAEVYRDKLAGRDEKVSLKKRMFQQVLLERRLERYKNMASTKDQLIDDLADLDEEDIEDMDFGEKKRRLDLLNEEIERIEEDTEPPEEEAKTVERTEVNVQNNVHQNSINTGDGEVNEEEAELTLEERKLARKRLKEQGYL